MPEDLQPLYPALRLVTGGYCTRKELDEMTLDDVDDLNIVLVAEMLAAREQQARGR